MILPETVDENCYQIFHWNSFSRIVRKTFMHGPAFGDISWTTWVSGFFLFFFPLQRYCGNVVVNKRVNSHLQIEVYAPFNRDKSLCWQCLLHLLGLLWQKSQRIQQVSEPWTPISLLSLHSYCQFLIKLCFFKCFSIWCSRTFSPLYIKLTGLWFPVMSPGTFKITSLC